jgi:hypothetical protein
MLMSGPYTEHGRAEYDRIFSNQPDNSVSDSGQQEQKNTEVLEDKSNDSIA